MVTRLERDQPRVGDASGEQAPVLELEQVVELPLASDELAGLQRSAAILREALTDLKALEASTS